MVTINEITLQPILSIFSLEPMHLMMDEFTYTPQSLSQRHAIYTRHGYVQLTTSKAIYDLQCVNNLHVNGGDVKCNNFFVEKVVSNKLTLDNTYLTRIP
jgi:hypothetical protein